jgi:hypothetical protein
MLKGIEAQISKIGRLNVIIDSENTAHGFLPLRGFKDSRVRGRKEENSSL